MTMGRYLCQLCYTIVHYGEKHPCFYYKDDEAVYVIPQQEDTDEICSNRENAEISNVDCGNIGETAEQTRNTSRALTSPADSVFSIENKDNNLSRDFADRPSSSEAPFNAPNRKGVKDAHLKQLFELKKDEGAVAGPSAVHPHSLGPGEETQYFCNVCHKQFKQKSHLVIHYRIHTGEKPFVCDTCGKKFTEKGNLTEHLRTHSGEKPFVCDTCGKEFSRKQQLNRHLMTHTGEKPYKCDICGRSLADLRNFKIHVAAHNGGKRYICSVCGKTFSRNDYRNRHFREKH